MGVGVEGLDLQEGIMLMEIQQLAPVVRPAIVVLQEQEEMGSIQQPFPLHHTTLQVFGEMPILPRLSLDTLLEEVVVEDMLSIMHNKQWLEDLEVEEQEQKQQIH